MERPDGYPGLARAYGLQFSAPPRILDLGLLYRALLDKQVDLVAGQFDRRIARRPRFGHSGGRQALLPAV